jgi:hypothetical protein
LLSLTVLVRWASLDKLVLARWVRILLHARARARWACPFPGFLFVSLWTLDAPGGPVSFGHVCLAWCVDLCSLCGSTGGPALYRWVYLVWSGQRCMVLFSSTLLFYLC